MKNSTPYFGFWPLSLVFLLLCGLLFLLSRAFPVQFPLLPLLLGNLLFSLLMMLSLYLLTRSSKTNMGFFSGFYLSTLVRLLLSIGIIVALYKLGNLPRSSLFPLLGNYFIYMMVEIILVNRWLKKYSSSSY